MKLIYALCKQCLPERKGLTASQTERPFVADTFVRQLLTVFRAELSDLLTRNSNQEAMSFFMTMLLNGESHEIDLTLHREAGNHETWVSESSVRHLPEVQDTVVFLPSKEMLAVFPGFLSLHHEYHLPYDGSDVDAITLLGLPYLNSVPEEFRAIIDLLEDAVGGRIYLNDSGTRFLMQPHDDQPPLEINLVAEGWRQLGMIMQLLGNGGLRGGGMLLWDEPDANLNPSLCRILAKTLVNLSRAGIQTFVSAHNTFLLYELELLLGRPDAAKDVPMRIINLKGEKGISLGECLSDFDDILSVEESIAQSERYLQEE